ncbi:hypothetical protein RP20_CCG020649 [Aedes albopictus]|nr:hypothetical protein RP20_CCG020649 [Aedes albopictus]
MDSLIHENILELLVPEVPAPNPHADCGRSLMTGIVILRPHRRFRPRSCSGNSEGVPGVPYRIDGTI